MQQLPIQNITLTTFNGGNQFGQSSPYNELQKMVGLAEIKKVVDEVLEPEGLRGMTAFKFC
jgi:hypothetical protein